MLRVNIRLAPWALVAGLIVAGTSASAVADGVHWTYDGDTGPDHWGDLSSAYAACTEGDEQSPIDLPASSAEHTDNATFDDAVLSGSVTDTGHSVQFSPDEPGASITYDQTTYRLAQFHVHTPSEHTVAGVKHDAEAHLVFAAGDELLVTGILIDEGAGSVAWDDVIDATHDDAPIEVDIASLMPTSHEYWSYDGSLTTPPCSESVEWLVFTHGVTMTSTQLQELAVHDENARPVQELSGRTIAGGHIWVNYP